jgi:1-aminocyclopropane-1-carboxylate deaminase/D-cysteine desulfhydrase-like pyridoxal-dependent ACC family enzyme
LSGKPFGGNKVRKLEFLLADALYKGVNKIIAIGGAGSNCTLVTIFYAKQLGLKCVAMLKPQANSTYVRNNLLLSYYHDAQLHHYQSEQLRNFMVLSEFLSDKNKYGHYPYLAPLGSSSPVGIIGFVNAAFELKEQIKSGIMSEPDLIYIPLGSMGTAVGLILGLKAAGIKSKVIPVRVIPYQGDTAVLEMFQKTNNLLHNLDSSFPLFDVCIEDFNIEHKFIGDGFGVFTQEGIDAIKLLKDEEDITLDGTFTGKTFAALAHDVKQKKIDKNKTILFWNTYCEHSIVPDIDYKKLPFSFHHYFEEDVQELDSKLFSK